MFSSWIRRTVFWTVDYLKGGKIEKHLHDIANKMEGKVDPTRELQSLLQYAQQYVPYYRGKGYFKLSDFPVIDKTGIMKNCDQFRSQEYLNDANLHVVSTSGSSGNPFRAFLNTDKRCRVIAELAYIHDINGWKIGDRYVFLRAWTEYHNKTRLHCFKQNVIPIEATGFDNKAIDSLRDKLKNDSRIRAIIGYSSSLTRLAERMKECGDKPDMFRLKVIIADSDNLTTRGKADLEDIFGCPVINRYDNEEQGIIAYTAPYNDLFFVNKASYFIEVLSIDSDEPAKEGETGRVVITDYYNRAMPFIRYNTGDLATVGKIENGMCTAFSELQGRFSDAIYDENGNAVYAASINNYLSNIIGIANYQLIEEAVGTFRLLIVNRPGFDEGKNAESALKRVLGQSVTIKVSSVEKIAESKNGKFRPVLSHCAAGDTGPRI